MDTIYVPLAEGLQDSRQEPRHRDQGIEVVAYAAVDQMAVEPVLRTEWVCGPSRFRGPN